MRQFKAAGDPQWAFPAALAAFQRKGDTAAARKALDTAMAANPHVTLYLTGRRKLPKTLPAYYSPGDQDEAVIYLADGGLDARATVPGALAWINSYAPPARPTGAAATRRSAKPAS